MLYNYSIINMNILLSIFFFNILILWASVVPDVIKPEANLGLLTDVFFSNLQEIPYLKGNTLSVSHEEFIDKQVDNYLVLIKRTYNLFEHSLTRRSLPNDGLSSFKQYDSGFHLLDGFIARFNIKVSSPKDIVLFEHGQEGSKQWFAAVLECKGRDTADDLVIYKFGNHEFSEIQRVTVINGIKIKIQSYLNSTLLVVAEYNTPHNNFYEKTGVYEFTSNNELVKIQHLDNSYESDVVLWANQHQLFMLVLQYMINSTEKVNYEVDAIIYRWKGKHFDAVDHLRTYGAKAATSFTVENAYYLAIANFRDNSENTNIYSEIFKYNLHTEKYDLYQKFLTNAAVDVKYFYFKYNGMEEHFLVFANLYEKDDDALLNYETDSIIYKLVDNYFIPFQSFKLNGVRQWLHLSGPNGECFLIAVCKFEGIKTFYYNGWRFIESQVQYIDEAFLEGVASMHSYQVNDTTLIALANKNDHGDMMNVFEATFVKQQDEYAQFQEEMQEWCERSFKSVQIDELWEEASELPKSENLVLGLGESNSFDNITIENLKNTETTTTIVTEEERLKTLQKDLESYSKDLEEIESQVQTLLGNGDINMLEGNIYIKKLNATNVTFESVNVDSINGIKISNILDDVINIDEGFVTETEMVFENITVNNKLTSKFVNGHLSLQNVSHLIIEGDVECRNGIILNGTLNGINFTEENISFGNEDQEQENPDLQRISVDELVMQALNDNTAQSSSENNEDFVVLQDITNLTVKNVIIEGYINGMDASTLFKYALRKFGNQNVEATYTFDNLIVNNMNVQTVSGVRIPEDLIMVDNGHYEIEHDVKFVNNITVGELILTERLNDIPVINGKLDVLLSHSDEMQYITGHKYFKTVELLNPIKLQGTINHSNLNKMNPVTIVDEEITLEGDYVITGNVIIEKLFQASDLVSSSQRYSVRRLQDRGIHLTSTEIPVHLHFTQQLHVEHLFTDKINDMYVNSLVVTGLEEPQFITGWKKFLGDVIITGSTNLVNVNGINLQELEGGTMKMFGEQSLAGKHHFENVVANRIYNVRTQFGGHEWSDVITTYGNQTISGTTVISHSAQMKHLTTNTLNFNSHINEHNFNAIINDTVFIGEDQVIAGHKEFVEIIAANIHASNLDLEALPLMIENARTTFQLDEDIDFPNDITIENIRFNNYFNEIPSENFGHPWLITQNEQVIESSQKFNKIVIYGSLFIGSGLINGVSIIDMEDNTVKIDEPFHFGTVTFLNGLASFHPITLEGQFESLYINDIVQGNTHDEQIIFDQVTFKENVTVHGQVIFNGLVSGMNMTQFCEMTLPDENIRQNLYIKGSAYFAKGPEVYYINDVPIQYILENAWFKNQETQLTGHLQFNHVVFEGNVIVHGLVDGVNLESVAQTYFSKSQDQNITALLDFDGGVVFAEGIYAKEATVGENVNGVNLEEFVHTAILDNYEQVFESTLYLENCAIGNLEGEYLVNELDLRTDVMRYDVDNIVTGKKIIRDVQTYSLEIDKSIKVQDVDILDFLHGSVLRNGTFSIPGKTVLHNYTSFENGLNSPYLVNGMKFNSETVMLKSLDQTITGRKTIFGNPEYPITFKSLKLKGLLNGIDMSELLYYQALQNSNIDFNGPVNFNTEIAASNVNIEKLYQGVNVSELLYNISRLESFDNYEGNYNKLLNISLSVLDSLNAQASFLDYYNLLQVFRGVHQIIPFTLNSSGDQFLATVLKNGQNYSIHFHVWDKVGQNFRSYEDMGNISIPHKLNYVRKIIFKGREQWYIENEHEESETEVENEGTKKFKTTIYALKNNGLAQSAISLIHNGTRSVASVFLPDINKSCILLVFSELCALYCEAEEQNRTIPLNLYQGFEMRGAIQASSIVIQDVPYIFIAYSGTLFDESNVDVWKYNRNTKQFELDQTIYITQPNSISTIFYQQTHYLAIASGYLQDAKDSGLITILKFNRGLRKFTRWQDIIITIPLQLELIELPTKELILYVLTNNASESLVVFTYEGLSGFKRKTVASTAPKLASITSFTTSENRHFIIANNADEMNVIEAKFKC